MRGGYCWEVFLRELLSHIFHLLYHRPGSKHEWMAPASVWGTLQSGNDIFPRQCVAASVSLFVPLPGPVMCYGRLRQTEDGSEEYLLPGTHSHSRRMSRAGGENSLTLCVFSWFMETFAETCLQELQMCEMTWGDTKMSKPRIDCPGIHWFKNAVLPCARPGIAVHATDPPWSPPLSGCLPGFFNEGKGGK